MVWVPCRACLAVCGMVQFHRNSGFFFQSSPLFTYQAAPVERYLPEVAVVCILVIRQLDPSLFDMNLPIREPSATAANRCAA